MTLAVRLVALGLLSFFISACANTASAPHFAKPIESDLSTYPSISVAVGAPDSVGATAVDFERIRLTIVEAINQERAAWAQTGNTGPLQLEVQLTRYEPGSAFARFMLAGLGQIHIDADVVVRESQSGEEIGSYSVSKTFAWGGLVGASTTIVEVETGFAKSVAEGVSP